MAPLAWHHTDQVSQMACYVERYVLGLTRGSGCLIGEVYPLGWGFAIWYDRSNEPIAHPPLPPLRAVERKLRDTLCVPECPRRAGQTDLD